MVYRNCKICGTRYKVCPTCENIRTFTPWRTVVCSPDEFILYETLSRYDYDKDAQAAVQVFKDLKLTKKKIKTYLPTVQTAINNIIAASKATEEETTE